MSNIVHQNSVRHSNRSSPSLPIHNGTNQHFNSHNYFQTPAPTPVALSSIQCSAYFIHRVDLDNYTVYTLKETVDNVVSGRKSKGLKVILSLPDEGLIIDNIPDPNQSWMYKRAELLYFWHDFNFINLIVIITVNRSYYPGSRPFSASIFRLRGHDSVQMFLQRAQQFFAQLLASSISRTNSTTSVDKFSTNERTKKKSKHRSTPVNEQPIRKSSPSRQTTPIRLVTRAEFEPGKTNSISQSNNQRTSSDTVDAQISNLKPEDNKSQISNENVAELVRELKELRNEIAALKHEARFTPVRSTSTSPLPEFVDNVKQRMNSSTQSDIDAETQTDFPLFNPKPSEMNETPSFPIRPIPILKPQQNDITSYPTENTNSSLLKQTGDVVSFNSSLENTIPLPENIYANVPVLLKTESNQAFYYNIPFTNENNPQSKSPLNVTIVGNQNSESEKQYLSQLFGPQNGISLLIPPQPSIAKEKVINPPKEITVNSRPYPEQIAFANYLTNPLFNGDKQLLANTIANQFNIDINSPYLQQLITNQHLFLTNKRTFANMIWQITPEEQNILCSSPITTKSNIIINTVQTNSPTAKSILKSTRSIPKKQHISWDSALG